MDWYRALTAPLASASSPRPDPAAARRDPAAASPSSRWESGAASSASRWDSEASAYERGHRRVPSLTDLPSASSGRPLDARPPRVLQAPR